MLVCTVAYYVGLIRVLCIILAFLFTFYFIITLVTYGLGFGVVGCDFRFPGWGSLGFWGGNLVVFGGFATVW